MMKILLLLAFFTSLFAGDDYLVRVAMGRADSNDLGHDIIGDMAPYSQNLGVIVLDGGYKLIDNLYGLPLDFYIKGGISEYLESGHHNNVWENDIYLKAFYDFNFLGNVVRLGFGEGVSYTYGTIYAEKLDAMRHNGKNSNFLNYLDISLDFDTGKLLRYTPLKQTYFGIALKHRSGIFGLINNVKHGGSNYEILYVEKSF